MNTSYVSGLNGDPGHLTDLAFAGFANRESGTGWLPYWLHRLDEHREWLHDTECAALSLSASEYFDRQCVISTEAEDDCVAGTIASVGADHVLWASDFPHPDALFHLLRQAHAP